MIEPTADVNYLISWHFEDYPESVFHRDISAPSAVDAVRRFTETHPGDVIVCVVDAHGHAFDEFGRLYRG